MEIKINKGDSSIKFSKQRRRNRIKNKTRWQSLLWRISKIRRKNSLIRVKTIQSKHPQQFESASQPSNSPSFKLKKRR